MLIIDRHILSWKTVFIVTENIRRTIYRNSIQLTAGFRCSKLILIFAITSSLFDAALATGLDKTAITHKNGLTAVKPNGYSTIQLADGFNFLEQGDVRSPRTLTIRIVDEQPQNLLKHKNLGGINVAYRLEILEGGSGGSEYRLIAVRPIRNNYLLVEAHGQSEVEPPTLDDAWALLSNSKF